MRILTVSILLLFFLNNCTTNKKFEKETCQQIHGLFTKSMSCLELKFININPTKYRKYEQTHNLILKALANQVYQSRISNVQVWLIYDDIINDFEKSKNKENYLAKVLEKYD